MDTPRTMPLNVPESELHAWLRLSLEPGLGATRIRLLLSVFGMPQHIVSATTGSLARYLDPALAAQLRQPPAPEVQASIEQALDWLRADDHHLLTLSDPLYPAALLDLSDPPPVLYAHGRLDVLRHPMLAIVGARHATADGERDARAFANHLAQQGWCVVSGLATGIDGAAHLGALDAGASGGGTIAVLGTGIDRVHPASHHGLAHRIATQGLLLSEFPLQSPGLAHHFPQRNRIVAALSQGVLVVQAATRSGSLITARLAGELGREVFAIPGSIHSPLSRGCHALIRQGAKLVESGQDIIEELRQGVLPGVRPSRIRGPRPAPDTRAATGRAAAADSAGPDGPGDEPYAGMDPDDAALLQRIALNPVTPDTLQAELGWPIDRLLSRLTLLEIDGRIQRTEDGRYQRSH